MSEKKYQRVNLYPDYKKNEEGIVYEINDLLKKIKTGCANFQELTQCKKLTKTLKYILNKSNNLSESDKWIAKETVEMSNYTCKKYGHLAINDKI